MRGCFEYARQVTFEVRVLPAQVIQTPTPTPQPLSNGAICVDIAVPSNVTAGQQFSAVVKMRNTGTTTWTSGERYKVGSQNPENNTIWRDGRVALPPSIMPGQEAGFNFTN